jgi:F420-dependent oxidoreductase-like protein
MKFGIHNPSWIYDGGPHEIFQGVKAKAQWAEEHGYSWFSVMDHMIQLPFVGPSDEPFMEGWTAITALAAVTSKIRLATLVSSVGYRNPAHLAKIASGVDIISRGRLTLGIGAGWHDIEYKQYGWEFPPRPATRIAQLEDAVKLIKTMWTEPRATYHGKYFHVEQAILESKPVQKPHPPILVGGSGEQLTLRVVARHANACNLFGDPEVVQHKLEVLQRHCDKEKRDYGLIERTNSIGLMIAKDEAALKAKMQRLHAPDPYRGYALTVAQAVELAGRYERAGVQTFICSFFKNEWESMQLLAEEVMPHFRQV